MINLFVNFRKTSNMNYGIQKRDKDPCQSLPRIRNFDQNLIFLSFPEIQCSKRFTLSFHNETWDRHLHMKHYISSVHIFIIPFSLSDVHKQIQHITCSSFPLHLQIFVFVLINTFVLLCLNYTPPPSPPNTIDMVQVTGGPPHLDPCWRCLCCVEVVVVDRLS